MKVKEAGRRILEAGFNAFRKTKISRIPGIFQTFSHLVSIFGGYVYYEVDGQKMMAAVTPPKNLLFGYPREFEPAVTSLFCLILQKSMKVVDVGAAAGYYTLLAAKRVGDEGMVLAFEPDPYQFDLLNENVKLNKWNNVRTFQLAISDIKGEGKVGVGGIGFTPGGGPVADAIRVKIVPLDSFSDFDIDLVKIDAEGAELKVLRGMKKILGKGKAKVICEIHHDKLSLKDLLEISTLLRRYGYKIYLIGEGGKLIPMNTISSEKYFVHYLFQRKKFDDR